MKKQKPDIIIKVRRKEHRHCIPAPLTFAELCEQRMKDRRREHGDHTKRKPNPKLWNDEKMNEAADSFNYDNMLRSDYQRAGRPISLKLSRLLNESQKYARYIFEAAIEIQGVLEDED